MNTSAEKINNLSFADNTVIFAKELNRNAYKIHLLTSKKNED